MNDDNVNEVKKDSNANDNDDNDGDDVSKELSNMNIDSRSKKKRGLYRSAAKSFFDILMKEMEDGTINDFDGLAKRIQNQRFGDDETNYYTHLILHKKLKNLCPLPKITSKKLTKKKC